MAVRPAALMEMEELVEEFLLRLPPDDPARLVRAALVCKLWRRILAGRGFRRRFCELHRRAPLLGVLVFPHNEDGFRFMPTSSFRPRNADVQGRFPIDCRHGRVLLARSFYFSQFLQSSRGRSLAVWDPISGDLLELPKLPAPRHLGLVGVCWNAAVLCASNSSSACDSIDCHLGHFLVVLLGIFKHRAYVFVYSSQAGTWSNGHYLPEQWTHLVTTAALDPLVPDRRLYPTGLSALAGNALYFKVSSGLSLGILKYDLGTPEISSVNLPPDLHGECQIMLTTAEYGGLGIARVEKGSSRLHLWSREAGPGGHLGWAPSRVIELSTLLPTIHSTYAVAFLHGLGAFLVSTDDGVFIVDPESNRARKVCEGSSVRNVSPYMCFCTPAPDLALTNTGEGPGASVPSA